MGKLLLTFGKPAIVLSCMFPFFMLFVEWFLKVTSFSSGTGAIDFFGPSLASAGLGFLVPLTIPKSPSASIGIDKRTIKSLEEKGVELRLKGDDTFSQFVWLAILVFLCVWMVCLHISSNYPNMLYLQFPVHLWLGLFNYFIGVILTCAKEVL